MTQESPVIRYEDAAEQRTVTGWACKQCGRFWNQDEHMARYCCCTEGPCEECGARRDRHNRLCEDCRKKKDAEVLRQRIADAEDITDTNYAEMVFVEELDDGENGAFFASAQDAAEAIRDAYFDDDESPRPEWAFACDPQHYALDVDEMIENLCSDGYEDMESNQTIPKSLRKAVDHFNKINAKWLTAWHPDYSRKIRIPELKEKLC